MPKFGKSSLAKLETVHPDLQRICRELIKELDITVLCGVRGEKEQNAAFVAGHSKLQYPRSKHNKVPSEAVDIAPYNAKKKGIDWNDIPAFIDMCKRVERIAKELGIKIRLGRDFSFKDYPHVELHDKAKK